MTEPFDFADSVGVILFDAGNTLLWIDHARLARALQGEGVDTHTDAVRDAEIRARPQLDPHLIDAPKRESPEVFGRYLDLILDNVGLAPDAPSRATLHATVQPVWASLWTVPPEDAAAALGALRSRGYRLGVVSNSNGGVGARLDAAGLREFFECIVDSELVGVEKPDPAIFRIAAEELGAAPGECVYVGDFHALDVVGARAAGMHAVLIDPIGVWGDYDAPKVRSLADLVKRLDGHCAHAAPASSLETTA